MAVVPESMYAERVLRCPRLVTAGGSLTDLPLTLMPSRAISQSTGPPAEVRWAERRGE